MPRGFLIQARRDTAANWAATHPTPAAGELCFETDTGILRVGDGTTVYTSLPSCNGATVDAELTKVANSNLSATHKITRSATLVVAASDSSAKSKAQADYVCDGTNDEVEIAAAISTVSGSGGGSIFLAEGNYSASIISILEGVRLIIDSGAVGITYNVADGITCVAEDYTNGNIELYENGAITNIIKADIEKPRLQVQYDGSYYYPFPVRTLAGHFTCSGSKVQGFPVFIINPTTGDSYLYRIFNGQYEKIATINTTEYGRPTVAYPNRVGGWAMWSPDSIEVADAYAAGTMRFFSSAARITESAPLSTLTGCRRPHEVNAIVSTSTGRLFPDNYYHMWGEYSTDPIPENLRIMRIKAGGTFEAVLTVPSTDIRHFHSLDGDPYNPGTFYATTGDEDPQVKVYKSTDYGDTWTEIAGGSQLFRTLRLSFDENYIYWATDGYVDGYGVFVRATRSAFSTPEILFTLPANLLSYGITKTFSPPGIVITTHSGWVAASIPYAPLYFYSFETNKIYKILNAKTVTPTSSVGYQDVLPYQNEQDGLIYMRPIGINRIYTDLGGITSIVSGFRVQEI